MGKRKGEAQWRRAVAPKRWPGFEVGQAQDDPRLKPFRYHYIEPVETTYIPTRGEFAQCGAMAYLAVLAYPKQEEWAKRDKFIEAAKALLCKWWIKRAGSLGETKLRRVAIGREYSGFKNELIDGGFSAVRRRIVWRMRAREAANWFSAHGLKLGPFKADLFRSAGVPAAMDGQVFLEIRAKAFGCIKEPTRWTAALGLSERLQEDRRQLRPAEGKYVGWQPENVSTRILRDSEPVLHLAYTLPLGKTPDGSPKLDLLKLILDPDWLEKSMRWAEINRCWLLPRVYPNYDPKNTVCLLPEGFASEVPSKF